MNLKEEIKKFFKGEVEDDAETLKKYSHDASLFEVMPKLVVFPKDSEDIQKLTKWVEENKSVDPTLSMTVRAAGSCMSGGPLNESIIVDVMRHMNKVGSIEALGTTVEPGVYYRDFEPLTLQKSLILPCFTASKGLNALGGMIGNNSAGEKTLRYGKMENYVLESKVVFSDGNEYAVKPLSREELNKKIEQNNFEGNVYKKLYDLLETNKEIIKEAKPKVSKNSAGYYLWNVYPEPVEGSESKFDLNKLIVGSQGTLGIVTEAKIKLVPVEPVSKLFVIFMRDLKYLAAMVNDILPSQPESLETYDDATLKLAFRFLPEMAKTMKAKSFFKLLWSFWPEVGMMLEGGFPKLVMLVEYTGKSEIEVAEKMRALKAKIAHYNLPMRETKSPEEAEKYWTIRRESFNLLRKHVHGSRTAPFVDDVVVLPKDMPEFLPAMRKILDKYKLVYTIAGHAGNGNFHIIPLMDMHNKANVEVIKWVGEEVYSLVAKYHGSITGEHNDGIVRTPYLGKMYSSEMLELFQQAKNIFDPHNIFNPGKKVPSTGSGQADGSIDYLAEHIAIE
jgi:FAD/FMN-containing dehydrogenase